MTRAPVAVPSPANTMTGVQAKAARMDAHTERGVILSRRIVHIRFRREVYSDCHMMITPVGAILLGLDLILTALVAVFWIGNPRE